MLHTRRAATRISLSAVVVLALAAVAGCGSMSPPPPSNLVALTTQLRGANARDIATGAATEDEDVGGEDGRG